MKYINNREDRSFMVDIFIVSVESSHKTESIFKLLQPFFQIEGLKLETQ